MFRALLAIIMLLSLLPNEATGAVKREMRSAWLTTVWGIDWPSSPGATSRDIARQKRELIEILDKLKSAGLNAVNFQVRSMCDAMYRSSLEPWSRFLTGERGKAPANADWDPLEFCVQECHKRGMECHAWVNPFRFANGKLPSTPFDEKVQDKGWVITYGKSVKQGRRWVDKSVSILNPGNEDVRAHIVAVCREIVEGYDIDGLVFDDYFYPRDLPLGKGYDYDDWEKSGSGLSQEDWRRDNVRKTVAEVYAMIMEEKPYLRFGISPAGVAGGNGKSSMRYGLPASYAGNDWVYDGIYCDPLAWLEDGTIDYISPQIYWACDHSTNPYQPIAQWWSEVALHFGRHFFASQTFTGVTSEEGALLVEDRKQQIEINREENLNNAPGTMMYSVKNFTAVVDSIDVASSIGDWAFSTQALTPAMTWKLTDNPGEITGLWLEGNRLTWDKIDGVRYAVYAIPLSVDIAHSGLDSGEGIMAEYLLGVSYINSYELPSGYDSGYWYAVVPYDRYSVEWRASVFGIDNDSVLDL